MYINIIYVYTVCKLYRLTIQYSKIIKVQLGVKLYFFLYKIVQTQHLILKIATRFI